MISMLAAYYPGRAAAIAAAGGIPPLIALLASPSVGVHLEAASALRHLSVNAVNEVTIASAGAPLIALLASTLAGVQECAAGALGNLSVSVENMVTIASAGGGGIPPLIALLGSSSLAVQEQAARALRNLSVNVKNMVTITSAGRPVVFRLSSRFLRRRWQACRSMLRPHCAT